MAWPLLKTAAGVAGEFLGEKFMEESLSFGANQMALLQDVQEHIQKLHKTYDNIRAVLCDAEDRRRIEDDNVKRWLVRLKASAFIADDLLDHHYTLKAISEFNSRVAAKRKSPELGSIETQGSSKRTKWEEFSRDYLPSLNPFTYLQRRRIHQSIEKIDNELARIAKDRRRFRLGRSDGSRRGSARLDSLSASVGTAAAFEEGSVIGRDDEKVKIVGRLLQNSLRGVVLCLIVLHGVAGIGKTCLAQLVVNDIDVMEYFGLRIWVSVLQGWDVTMVVKQIIQCLTRQKIASLSLNNYVEMLKNLIRGKKFLLVLDNLVGVDYRFWEILRVPLSAGAIESKILITTRDENTSIGMETLDQPIRLGGLSENDCWLLLRDKAFPERDWSRYPNLESIGRQIVTRCQGSPFAAKFLGFTLRKKTDEDEWSSILEEMWALKKNNNAVLSSLMVSYHHLDFHQKQCFAYCSLFPRGYEFERDELVRLWMAVGLIVPCRGRRPEAIGNDIFEVLCARSFLEHPSSEDQQHKMPNLIHDLARLVSKHETLVMEDNLIVMDENQSSEPKQHRYASLLYRNSDLVEFQKLYQYEHLRAIKYNGEPGCLNEVPQDIFSKLKFIRVLDVSYSLVETLPDSVGELIHLRYLGLRATGIMKLPSSIGNLYNLQTLELSDCYKLQKLPKSIVNLVNLRHICLHLNWETVKDGKLRSIPCGIGGLTSLQTLSRFVVAVSNGCKISELKNLNLREDLCISQLENVVDITDALEAKLEEKQYIKKLMLRWSNNNSDTINDNSMDVAEKLSPHKRIEKLCIENYPGTSFPDWLGNRSFSFLQSLKLSFCSNLEFFPFIGELPQLKNLKVEGMDRVTSMGNTIGFSSLETLALCNMSKLERLFDVASGTIPKLREIIAKNCPELKELSRYLQPGRIKVKLSNCPRLLDTDSSLPFSCDLETESD